MNSTTTTSRAQRKTATYHGLSLAAIAAAVLLIGGCSKSGTDSTAAASAPDPVVATAPATNPPVASTAPVAPATTVIAQNESQAYKDGRRDERAVDHRRDERSPPPRADRDGEVAPDQRVAAVSCPDCGVIESFDTVRVQGQTNGVGAVAGGVGGAVIGNRIAGRNDRTLGGVVGAIGGGLIGNAVEKHERATDAYDVHVRMADGSMRTVRQSTPPTVGAQVRVEADGLHARS